MKIMETLLILSVLGMVLSVMIPTVFAAGSTNSTGEASYPPALHFNLTSTDLTLCSGITNYIPITITNPNSDALGAIEDPELSVTGAKGVYATPVYANSVSPNSSVTTYMPVFLSGNASGLITIPVSINFYYFAEEYTDSEVRNLIFSVESCKMPLVLNVTPTVLGAGSYENLTINLTNIGSVPINYTTLKLSFPVQDAALIGNPKLTIDSIAPYSTTNTHVTIYVSKNATANFDANITANFYNGTKLEELSQTVAMIASGIINITPSSFTLSPTAPTAGSIFSISFVLTNVGTAGATAVTATPIEPKGLTTYGTNSTFIGDIGVDTQTPVTISILTSNSVKTGNYKLPIRLNYLNNLRQNVTVWANTSVFIGAATMNASQYARFRGGPEGGFPWLTVILIIIIIALVVLLYKEKQKDKEKRRTK